MPILKFKPFNNYFDEEFKVRFDHKDNNSNQIGRIYILFYYYYDYKNPYPGYTITTNMQNMTQDVGLINDFNNHDNDSFVLPHLRMKFKNYNDNNTNLNCEISPFGNYRCFYGRMLNGNHTNIKKNVIDGNDTYKAPFTKFAENFYTQNNKGYILDNPILNRSGFGWYNKIFSSESSYEGNFKTPFTFTNESYFYPNDLTNDYSPSDLSKFRVDGSTRISCCYDFPTNSQIGAIWSNDISNGKRGIYSFYNEDDGYGKTMTSSEPYNIVLSDNSYVKNGSIRNDLNALLNLNTPQETKSFLGNGGIFGSLDFYNNSVNGDVSTKRTGFFPSNSIDNDVEILENCKIKYERYGHELSYNGKSTLSNITETDEIQFDENTSSNYSMLTEDMNKGCFSNVSNLTERDFHINKNIFLISIPFELQKRMITINNVNVTKYVPILKENCSNGTRIADLTQPIEFDFVWSNPLIPYNQTKDNYDHKIIQDDKKAFIEENENGNAYRYLLSDSEIGNKIRIDDSHKNNINTNEFYNILTENKPIQSGIVPLAMKTVYLCDDKTYTGGEIKYEQNIDYIFIPNTDVKSNYYNFECNPYSQSTEGNSNVYVSKYPDFGIKIDTTSLQ